MKYKAIFSDFDGTIYSDSYDISKRNIEAVRDFRARGGRFFVATGRLFRSVRPNLATLGLTEGEVIVYQGGGIFDIATGKPLWVKNIACADAVECLRKLENDPRENVQLTYIDDRCYSSAKHPAVDLFCSICKIPCEIVGEKLSDYVERLGIDPTKVLAIAQPDDAYAISKEYVPQFDGRLSFTRSQKFLVEFTAYGISKGEAVKKVCEKYGLDRSEIICMGDADNDISMIEYAGLGVAVMNAMPTTKEHADVIGASNNNDAVAWVVDNYCGGDV